MWETMPLILLHCQWVHTFTGIICKVSLSCLSDLTLSAASIAL